MTATLTCQNQHALVLEVRGFIFDQLTEHLDGLPAISFLEVEEFRTNLELDGIENNKWQEVNQSVVDATVVATSQRIGLVGRSLALQAKSVDKDTFLAAVRNALSGSSTFELRKAKVLA